MTPRTISCRESRENLVADLRGELSPAESGDLKSHLEACSGCRQERTSVRDLANVMRQVPVVAPAANSFAALRTRIEQEPTTASPKGRGRRLLYAGFGLAAAAAALLLILVPSSSSPTLTLTGGELLIENEHAILQQNVEIEPGTTLAAPEMAGFTLNAERRVDIIASQAILGIGDDGAIIVTAGRILAEVRPGSGEVHFRTPAGTAVVTGTTLQLLVSAESTVLTVLTGHVTLRTGNSPVRVDSGTAVTCPTGGVPGDPVPVDPWQVRAWCSAPTAELVRTDLSTLLLTLTNRTVSPLAVKPFDAATAAYSLSVEGPDGKIRELKLQAVMVRSGERRPGDAERISLAPGEAYRLTIDPRQLGLSPGQNRIRASYRPYGDLDGVWRGKVETEPVSLKLE